MLIAGFIYSYSYIVYSSTACAMDSSQESTTTLMKKYLPEYLQNILTASGYEKLETIAKIDIPSDIDEMLKYINDSFSDHSKYVSGYIATS